VAVVAALPTRDRTKNASQKFVKTDSQSLKHKVNRCVVSLRFNKYNLHELLLVDCSKNKFQLISHVFEMVQYRATVRPE